MCSHTQPVYTTCLCLIYPMGQIRVIVWVFPGHTSFCWYSHAVAPIASHFLEKTLKCKYMPVTLCNSEFWLWFAYFIVILLLLGVYCYCKYFIKLPHFVWKSCCRCTGQSGVFFLCFFFSQVSFYWNSDHTVWNVEFQKQEWCTLREWHRHALC